MNKTDYSHTIRACFLGYVVQAIVNNFLPLLFVFFHTSYNISMEKITLLITVNFGIQLIVDLVSAGFVDRIGYRASIILAHVLSAMGFMSLVIIPDIFSDPFYGIIISVFIYAVGGGLLEVLVSPIVEACPTKNKESVMSLLHSFYCWGHVAVVALSTLFFAVFGIENWKIIALLWMFLPLINVVMFSVVPIYKIVREEEQGLLFKEIVLNKMFWILMLMMICAGAAEQSVSQWSSAFAEAGLGINKTVGDLVGPMFFAIMMGLSRTYFGKRSHVIKLQRFMLISTILCIISYIMISLSSVPVISLLGCGVCGFSVGIMWPGTFSMASSVLRRGGTMIFAFLALAGDLGCAGGPTFAGQMAAWHNGEIKFGILAAVIFPVFMLIGFNLFLHYKKSGGSFYGIRRHLQNQNTGQH